MAAVSFVGYLGACFVEIDNVGLSGDAPVVEVAGAAWLCQRSLVKMDTSVWRARHKPRTAIKCEVGGPPKRSMAGPPVPYTMSAPSANNSRSYPKCCDCVDILIHSYHSPVNAQLSYRSQDCATAKEAGLVLRVRGVDHLCYL